MQTTAVTGSPANTLVLDTTGTPPAAMWVEEWALALRGPSSFPGTREPVVEQKLGQTSIFCRKSDITEVFW